MAIPIINWDDASASEQAAMLQRPALRPGQQLRDRVNAILRDVRDEGDAALFRLTRSLDKASLTSLKVAEQEFDDAEKILSAAQIAAIDLAIANVRRFHVEQKPRELSVETMPGVRCRRISHALDAVGLYVPAGTAPLPSTAVMLAVPAAIAGCPSRIMCTPPRPDGSADAAVLVAARRAGVDDVFKIGGAQAVAAMAFGTESVPRVNKIFGPGNAWVTEAKTQVANDAAGAAIDMPAGPSEVLVIADAQANAEFIAADLLSQAEHGIDSQVILVTTSTRLARDAAAAIERQVGTLVRQDIIEKSLQNGRIIVVGELRSAVRISNQYAPEHLILHTGQNAEIIDDIRNAGSVFVGAWSPESVGDYCSGTNHVLPTYGHARSYSGLSVDHFVRHMTVQELSPDGLRSIGEAVIELATLEGLDAHAVAVALRLQTLETQP